MNTKYDITDLHYWPKQKNVPMHYSEEDCDIDEEDYYKLLDDKEKLLNIIKDQQKLIKYMDNYIEYLNYGIITTFGAVVCVGVAYLLS